LSGRGPLLTGSDAVPLQSRRERMGPQWTPKEMHLSEHLSDSVNQIAFCIRRTRMLAAMSRLAVPSRWRRRPIGASQFTTVRK
jgi:hypothetical protein